MQTPCSRGIHSKIILMSSRIIIMCGQWIEWTQFRYIWLAHIYTLKNSSNNRSISFGLPGLSIFNGTLERAIRAFISSVMSPMIIVFSVLQFTLNTHNVTIPKRSILSIELVGNSLSTCLLIVILSIDANAFLKYKIQHDLELVHQLTYVND